MADADVRIVELIEPKATFEVGGGRPGLFGYENEAATLRFQYGASPTANRLYVARRDAAQTFDGDQTFTGFVIGTAGDASTASIRHHKTGAHDATRWAFSSRATGDTHSRFVIKEGGLLEWGQGATRNVNLYAPSANNLVTDDTFTAAALKATDLVNGQVLRVDAGGAVSGDAGFTHTTSGGITRAVSIGDYAVPADVIFAARQTAGQIAGLAINDSAQNRRWTVSISTGTNFRVGRWTNSGTKVDDPIDIVAGSAGLITIGGNSNSATNFTGAIQTSGVQRISAGGAGSLTTLSTTGLAILAQATVSDITSGHVVFGGTAGRLQGHAGISYSSSGGSVLTVGDGTTATARIDLDGGAGTTVYHRLRQSGVLRWGHGIDGTTVRFRVSAYDASSVLVDHPLEIQNAAGGTIFLNRPTNLSGLTASRMLSLDASKNVVSLDAAASRTLIGIGDATGGAITVVQDASIAPPGSPVIGVPYLVGIGATGAWAGQDDKLATWSGATWSFVSRASLWTMCFNATSGTLLTNVDGSGNKLVFLPSLVCSGNIQGATVAGSNADFSGVYKTSGTQVVSTRKTGWVAATGTATRSTFATGSVTTTQLAERVKALIDDLISHGLIGA